MTEDRTNFLLCGQLTVNSAATNDVLTDVVQKRVALLRSCNWKLNETVLTQTIDC